MKLSDITSAIFFVALLGFILGATAFFVVATYKIAMETAVAP